MKRDVTIGGTPRASRGWHRVVPVPFAAFLATLLLLPVSAAALPPDPIVPDPVVDVPFVAPADGFEWSVPSRFGADADRDGLIDYHWNQLGEPKQHPGLLETYDPDYVHPSSLPADFDGCPTEQEAQKSEEGVPTDNVYVWEVPGQTYVGRNCALHHVFDAQDTYAVRLSVQDLNGNVLAGPFEQDVTIRDILIVALGDSYGSGEGNPDLAQILNNDGLGVFREAKWIDKRCHRSAAAGAAVAARQLEAADPHTSVTFLHFACSGATIERTSFDGGNPLDPYQPGDPAKPRGNGVLGTYIGTQKIDGATMAHLPSQIDQLAKAVTLPDGTGTRHIDALHISGGGNDAGFSPIATVCVLYRDCESHFVYDDNGGGQVRLDTRLQNDLEDLPGMYDRLHGALADPNPVGRKAFSISQVYVTEYPVGTTDDDGAPCGEMLEDVMLQPPDFFGLTTQVFSMKAQEVTFASDVFAPGLNRVLRDASAEYGWQYVDGIAEAFTGHGYCASNSWIRHANDASRYQGPWGVEPILGLNSGTTGTLHPTSDGFAVQGERIAHYMGRDLGVADDGRPVFSAFNRVGTTQSRLGSHGWLTGQCPLGVTCTSDGARFTVEVTDPDGIVAADVTVDGFGGCAPAGMSCTAALVDPTTYRWTFTINADGIRKFEFRARDGSEVATSYTREVKVDLHDPTAAAVPSSTGAPVGVRLDGYDTADGSGVAYLEYKVSLRGDTAPRFPSRAVPGVTVPIDTGGTFDFEYTAIDHAGRRGPLQTTSLDVQGPRVGASSLVSNGCIGEDVYYEDASSSLGEALLLNSGSQSASVRALRLTALADGHADYQRPGTNVHVIGEQCGTYATFDLALRVGAGTTGLAEGTPVTLALNIDAHTSVDYNIRSDAEFTASGSGLVQLRIADPDQPIPCPAAEGTVESGCLVEFQSSRGINATTFGGNGGLLHTNSRSVSYSSNLDAGVDDSLHEELQVCAAWPCSRVHPNRHTSDLNRTIEFATHVGARLEITGRTITSTQVYDAAGSASGLARLDADIESAGTFQGLALNFGDAVDVIDDVPPTVTAPADVDTATDPGLPYATVDAGEAIATDDVAGVTVVGTRSDGQALDAPYPLGVTTIEWLAADAAANTATVGQTITVHDREAPLVTAPANVTVSTDAHAATAIVHTGTATATDNIPGVSVAGTRSDGRPLADLYPVGATTITWTATDTSGNTATSAQTISVRDTEAPVFDMSAVTTNATSRTGATVAYALRVTDNVAVVSSSCVPTSGTTFAIGVTVVRCTATDAAGQNASTAFTVTVVGASGQLGDLRTLVSGMALPRTTATSFDTRLAAVQAALAVGRPSTACVRLGQFAVDVARGVLDRQVKLADGRRLLADSTRIARVIGC